MRDLRWIRGIRRRGEEGGSAELFGQFSRQLSRFSAGAFVPDELLKALADDVPEVHVALGIQRDAVNPVQFARLFLAVLAFWLRPELEQFASAVEAHEELVLGRAAQRRLGILLIPRPQHGRGTAHPDIVVFVDAEAPWHQKVRPRIQKFALWRVHLDARVVAVRDEDAVLAVDGDGVRDGELPRPAAQGAPSFEEAAGLVETHDARVAVAVGDKDIAVFGERHVGGHPHMGFVLSPLLGRTEGQQQLSVLRELGHRVKADIRKPHVTIGVQLDLVGGLHHASPPGFHEFTLGRVNLYRRFRARKNPDIVLGVYSDPRHLAPSHRGRFLRPIGVYGVGGHIVYAGVNGHFRSGLFGSGLSRRGGLGGFGTVFGSRLVRSVLGWCENGDGEQAQQGEYRCSQALGGIGGHGFGKGFLGDRPRGRD